MDMDAPGVSRPTFYFDAHGEINTDKAIDTWGMTEERGYWVERTLLKRVGQLIDIAMAIVLLASDEASYITGATLQVDGGTRLLV